MKRIKIARRDDDYRFGDSEQIRLALERQGYSATTQECGELWERFSESMCAGWIILPDDDSDILASVRPYFDDGEDDDDDY